MAARKTSTAPTRIWKFGALAPIANGDKVDSILDLSSRYYERLTVIERARQRRYQLIRRKHVPELGTIEDASHAANQQIRELYREAKRFRQKRWVATGGEKTLELPPGIKEQVDALKAEVTRLSEEGQPLRDAFAESIAKAHRAFERRSSGLPPALLDSIDAVRDKIKDTQRQLRKASRAKADTAALKQELGALKAEAASLDVQKSKLALPPRIRGERNKETLAEMLQEDWPVAWKELAESDARARTELKLARAACKLPPGTYLQVEEAFNRAKQDSFPDPPSYYSHDRNFSGGGKIAVQLGKETFASIVSDNSAKFRLTRNVRPGARGKQEQYWTAHIQIARNMRKRSDHLWASFPVKLDRLPPEDAVIKWAWIIARKRGERLTYELQLTLEHPSLADPKRPAGVGDGGHVRIGWGATATGVRVAQYAGGDVVVPLSILEQGEHSPVLRGHADAHFHTVKRVLKLWMGRDQNRLLYWDRIVGDRKRLQFREMCVAYAEHRLGTEKVIELWKDWKQHRLSANRDLFAFPRVAHRWISRQGFSAQEDRIAWWLYLWARKDAHLRQYSADALRRFENRREAFFRQEAIRIATQYETITVDKYNIAALKRLPELKLPGEPVNDRATHNLRLAAPGRFREILLETMGTRCKKSERSGDEKKPRTARKGKKRRDPVSQVDVSPPAAVAKTGS